MIFLLSRLPLPSSSLTLEACKAFLISFPPSFLDPSIPILYIKRRHGSSPRSYIIHCSSAALPQLLDTMVCTYTHTLKETVLQSTSHFIAIGCQLQQYIIRWKKKQRRFESKPYTYLTAPVRAMIRRVCKIAFFWVIRNNASFIPLSPKQEPLQYLNKAQIAAKAESQHYLITSRLFLSIIFSWIVGQRA